MARDSTGSIACNGAHPINTHSYSVLQRRPCVIIARTGFSTAGTMTCTTCSAAVLAVVFCDEPAGHGPGPPPIRSSYRFREVVNSHIRRKPDAASEHSRHGSRARYSFIYGQYICYSLYNVAAAYTPQPSSFS